MIDNNLTINEYNYFDLAMQKKQDGDLVSCLQILRNLEIEGTKNIDVYAEMAEIYFEMEIYPMCQEYWFKYLSHANNSSLKARAYRGLGASFCLDREIDLMTYYYDKKFMSGKQQEFEYDEVLLDYLEFHEKEFPQFYVSYPYSEMTGRALIRSGEEALGKENINTAIERFLMVSPQDERFNEAVFRVCVCYAESGRENEILPYLKEQIERTTNKARIALFICEKLDENSEELKTYLDIAFSDGGLDDAHSYYQLAFYYCQLGLFKRALECLDRSLEFNPYQVLSIYLKGVIYYNQGEIKKSQRYFKKLYDITNDIVSLYCFRLCMNEAEQKNVDKLPYKFGLPEKEKTKKLAVVAYYIANGAKAIKKAKTEELIDLAEFVFWFAHNLEDEVVSIFIAGGNTSVKKYFVSKLLSQSVKNITKMAIVESLVLAGYSKKIDVVFDGIYLKVKLLNCDFEFGNEEVFCKAYAKAVSLSFPFEENLKELQEMTYKTYYTLQTNGKLFKVKNIDALTAIIIMLTDRKVYKTLTDNKFLVAKEEDIDEILNLLRNV